MTSIEQYQAGTKHFLVGTETIARGAVEMGVQFADGYSGTPSYQNIQRLSDAAFKFLSN